MTPDTPETTDTGEELPEDKHASPGTAPTVYPSPGVGHVATDEETPPEGTRSSPGDVRTADDIGRDAPQPSTSHRGKKR